MPKENFRKSHALAFLLTFFFGHLGTLYAGLRTFLVFMLLSLPLAIYFAGMVHAVSLAEAGSETPPWWVEYLADLSPYELSIWFGRYVILLYLSSMVVCQIVVRNHNAKLHMLTTS